MNPPPEEALFHLALAKPAPERAAFLDGACHGDAALRQRLEALLAAHEQPATYAADMNLVQRALELNDLGHARRLLDRHRPIDPDQEDIRGWEWRYLWKQVQSDAILTLAKRETAITSLAASSDGKWLAESREGRIFLLDLWSRLKRS